MSENDRPFLPEEIWPAKTKVMSGQAFITAGRTSTILSAPFSKPIVPKNSA